MQKNPKLEKFEITPQKLFQIKEIGRGNYGIVWQGTWDQTTDVAIKTLNINTADQKIQKTFWDEVEIMQDLNHPNIVRCFGFCSQPACLVMELMNQSLYAYLINLQNVIPWEIRIKICLDIVSGLKFIHDNRIIHRDFKSLNVLLDGTLKAKITDFGLARVKQESKQPTKSVVGTLRWMAPELSDLVPSYSFASDIFALGVTF